MKYPLLAAAALLAGCSPLQVLNAAVVFPQYELQADQTYGGLSRQRLDVYKPAPATVLVPVVVFFYGGRWQSGNRADYRFAGEAFSSRGFVTMVPDTRLFPESSFPGFVEDGAAAVKWAHDHAEQFGGDPNRIFLVGHSSGAHVAAMLTTDERYLRAAGVPEGVVDGMVGLAGPYDFLPFEDADVRALMGPEAQWPTTQPIAHVDGGEPPMLLLQGDADDIVRPHNAKNLAARAQEKGARAELKIYPGIEHYKIVAALAKPLRSLAPVLDDAVKFLESLSSEPRP